MRSHGGAGARGRTELLPGGGLSSLCLSWDSSAALNMSVIFNRRRNGAAPAPLSDQISSQLGGEAESGAALPGHMIRPNKKEEGVGGWGAELLGSHANVSTGQKRRIHSVRCSDVRGAEETGASASASCGGSQRAATAHGQRGEGLRDANASNPTRIRSL